MQGAQFLSAGQLLLTTLVVKLAVVAALATMLVRYRRFRHILIFERRDWPDRLLLSLALGLPLPGGGVGSVPGKPSGTSPRSFSRACTAGRGRCCDRCRSTGRWSCCSHPSAS